MFKSNFDHFFVITDEQGAITLILDQRKYYLVIETIHEDGLGKKTLRIEWVAFQNYKIQASDIDHPQLQKIVELEITQQMLYAKLGLQNPAISTWHLSGLKINELREKLELGLSKISRGSFYSLATSKNFRGGYSQAKAYLEFVGIKPYRLEEL